MAHENLWKKHTSKIVHENPWYKIRHDTVTRPDGKPGDYFVIVNGASAYAIALNEQDQILLIGQFRYPTNMYSWEVPGGRCDGADPLVSAQREFQEETGLTASSWTRVGLIQSYNGAADDIGHVFVARKLTQTKVNEQAEEGIDELRWVTFQQAFTMIKMGEISDAQTITAITQTAIYLKLIG